MSLAEKARAPRNRTVSVSPEEATEMQGDLLQINGLVEAIGAMQNQIVWGDAFCIADYMPRAFVDLLILDPPYNLTKTFGETTFKARSSADYGAWLEAWLPQMLALVKPTGTVYLCGDWRSSAALHLAAEKYLTVRNRITWEREKGRGAQENWKNTSEDIFFGTMSDNYFFDVNAVKLKKRVLAPYKNNGAPKDWYAGEDGNFRLTHPSNLWTDISVPFWSMLENTDHPTQKPEKLIAKLLLASSRKGDMVLDPFLGSGTTAVVAQKLGRNFVGIERELSYCALAQKRLCMARTDTRIQGYEDGVFWERNTSPAKLGKGAAMQSALFEPVAPSFDKEAE